MYVCMYVCRIHTYTGTHPAPMYATPDAAVRNLVWVWVWVWVCMCVRVCMYEHV